MLLAANRYLYGLPGHQGGIGQKLTPGGGGGGGGGVSPSQMFLATFPGVTPIQ